MSIEKTLKAARGRRKLSQAGLARLLGVSAATVAGWELGNHGIKRSRIHAVAAVLRVKVAALIEVE